MTLDVLAWNRNHDDIRPPGPSGWGRALTMLAAELGAEPVRWQPGGGPLRRRSVDFSWHPCHRTLASALTGRRLAYLCWGFRRRGDGGLGYRIANARLRLLTRNAGVVLCNDTITQARLRARFGVEARLVRWPVDVGWFSAGPRPEPRPEVLIPGSNDRDEALARNLAARGIPVIRVTHEPRVVAWHAANPTADLTVLNDIPFPELRALYRGCLAVALPLRETDHAAGQTAALEALAASARLIVSEGFTSSIVEGYPGVTVVPAGAGADDWARWLQAPAPPHPERVTGPILEHAPDRAVHGIAEAIRAAIPGLGRGGYAP